jgi:myo-inositol-1(or 4)-monophosphatase
VDRELAVAVDAATQAAAAVRAIWDREDAWILDKAEGRGPLTEADLASDEILHDVIRTAFPDDAILSEEVSDDPARLGKRRVWIIDPLDGTREFVDRIPEFVVSIGLAIDGEAVVGVLINPVTGEVMTGAMGLGVTYNGKPTSTTTRASLDGARVVVSRSETRKGWFERFEDHVQTEPLGSVAYKIGLVGTGRADATFTPKPRNEWDLCGGVAIVRAGGGRATNGAGERYRFNRPTPLHKGVVCTNGPLHEAVLDLIRS